MKMRSLFAFTAYTVLTLVPAIAQVEVKPGMISLEKLGEEAGRQYRGDGMGISESGEGALLRCALQKLEGHITSGGLWLRSTAEGDAGAQPFRIQAGSLGREAETKLAEDGDVEVADSLVRYVRSGLVEEYSVSADGVRQDFLVQESPVGSGPLRVVLEVTGAQAQMSASGVNLTLEGSGRGIAYSRLSVTDAAGRRLMAKMEVVTPQRLAVSVEDAGAVYPVRIDPTFSDAEWVSMGVLAQAAQINAVAVDPAGNLYVGGMNFSFVQGTSYSPQTNIARWNGSEWSTLGISFFPGSNPDVDGEVKVLKMHGTDLYVGGMFAMAGGMTANRVAKWDTVGRMWTPLGFGFQAGVSGEVKAIEVIGSDVYVAGSLSTAGGNPASGVAKWNSLTMNWSAVGSGMFPVMVESLAAMGGNLYAGGSFSEIGGVQASNVAKWSPTSGQWSALGAGVNSGVLALAVDGADLLAGGYFTLAGEVPAKGIAQWNGTAWSALGAGVNGSVGAIAVNGSDLYVGGYFTTSGGLERSRMALVSASGELDVGFNPGNNSTVFCSAKQADGKLLLGGYINSIGGVARSHLARLNADNTLDLTFNPTINSEVRAVAVQADGKILIAGGFTTVGGVTRNRVARLNTDSTLDSSFNPNVTGDFGATVETVAVQADAKILIGGRFTTVGGTARSYLARLNSDGTLDGTFAPVLNGDVDILRVQPDGKIIIRGNFSTIGGVSRSSLSRLNANGTLDTGFNPSTAGPHRCLTLQADGKILVGGGLTANGSGTTRQKLARFNTNGTLDTSFLDAGINGTVHEATVQPDGKILIGGDFTMVGGAQRSRLARLNADGTLDTGFAPVVSGQVSEIVVQANGGILFTGSYSSVGGIMVNNIARWDGSAWSAVGLGTEGDVRDLAVSGSVLFAVGGFIQMNGVGSLGIARLDIPTGKWTSPGVGLDGYVYSLAFSGSDLYVSGDFITAGGVVVNRIARWDGSTWSALGSGLNGSVYALAIHGTDVYAGGNFTTAGDAAANNIAKWSTTSGTWSPLGAGADWTVRALAVSGGSLYSGGFYQSGVARWDTVTSTWSSLGTGVSGEVKALAVSGSNLYVGGAFIKAGEQPSGGLAAMNSDGSLDSAFNLNAGSALGPYTCTAVLPDGEILVAGQPGPFSPSGLKLFYANGVINPMLNVNAPGLTVMSISAMAVQEDGKIVLAGQFTFGGNPQTFHVLRLIPEFPFNARYSLDAGFAPVIFDNVGPDGITAVAAQADGKVLVGGAFHGVGGQFQPNLARLNANGTLDGDYAPSIPDGVSAITLQADGRLLIASIATPNFLTRLNTDGTTDLPHYLDTSGIMILRITGIVIQTDGKIVLAGDFFNIGGGTDQNFLRFYSFGIRDTEFNPPSTSGGYSDITDLALRPNGGLLFVGDFYSVFAPARGIAKWNGTGWSSLGTVSLALAGVNALVINGSDLYVGGQFYLSSGMFGSTQNVARWDGSSWQPLGAGLNSTVNALAFAGGELYAGTMMGGFNAGIYKFDGTWTPLGPGVDQGVQALAAGSGSLYVGGWFTTAGGKHSSYLARAKLPASPEIAVRGNGVVVSDGDSTPDSADHTDFGNAAVSGGSVTRTYTLENSGTDVLFLNGTPRVSLSGGQAADFTVTVQPSVSSIVPNGSTTFQITFDPSAAGLRSTTVSIANSDGDENPYNFTILGTGTLPEIVVEQPSGSALTDGAGILDFGGLTVGMGVTRVFVVRNVGLAPLTGIGLVVGGSHPGNFGVSVVPSATLAPGGSTSFHITFTPSVLGTRSAALQVTSNDSDEAPFDISLTGEGLTATQGWAQTFFGTTTPAGDAAPTADPNQNGIPNLIEYALGGDPVGGTTGTSILPEPDINPAAGCMEFHLVRYLDRNDVTLTVQVADSLTGPWLNLARSINGAPFSPLVPGSVVTESGSGPTRLVSVCDIYQVNDPAHPKRFMMLLVTQ
jgi:uncharacterized delta-60 repeat protein